MVFKKAKFNTSRYFGSTEKGSQRLIFISENVLNKIKDRFFNDKSAKSKISGMAIMKKERHYVFVGVQSRRRLTVYCADRSEMTNPDEGKK